MHFKYLRGDLVLEDSIAPPWFELPSRQLAVLKAIYDALSPVYPLEPRDLRVMPADNFADYRLSVAAFGGRAKLEITPIAVRLSANQLTTRDDLAVIQDFAAHAERGIRSELPIERLAGHTMNHFAHLVADEPFDAEQFIAQFVADRAKLAPQQFGANECTYGPKVKLVGDRHVTDFSMERSALPNGSLFIACSVRYAGHMSNSAEVFSHSEQQLSDILAAYGVDL